jgi:transcriptional regulator with XRE-family HTH domain
MPRTAVSDVHAKVVGRELREARSALGLTQAEVAGRLGVSASYVSAVEAGKRNLTLAQLANIANAMRLGIDVSFVRPDGSPVRDAPPSRAHKPPAKGTTSHAHLTNDTPYQLSR